MLDNYRKVLDAPGADRIDLFTKAGNHLEVSERYIEKDFWVCLILDILFNYNAGSCPRLLFKGGTSLSKVYGLIQRFSEDIDLTWFSEDLGTDLNELDGRGNKARSKALKDLAGRCHAYMTGPLTQRLHECFSEIGMPEVQVKPEGDQTLLVHYPSLFGSRTDYVAPAVKIEGGARSARNPRDPARVEPYTQRVYDLGLAVPNVVTIRAERTFCDKIVILHGLRSGYDLDARLPEDAHRVSRHYYDLAMMKGTKTGEAAINDTALLADAFKHAQRFFPAKWRGLDNAFSKGCRIVPQDELREAIRRDYGKMQPMLFGSPPSFQDIMDAIQYIQDLLVEPLIVP